MENIEIDDYEIVEKKTLNHNVIELVLKSESNKNFSLPVSSFLYIFDDDASIKRPYTPINTEKEQTEGILEFAIKIYEKGKLSKYIFNKKIGDKIKVSRPILKKEFKKNEFKNVLMIAGGTGITPMIQILKKSIEDQTDETKFILLFCNLSENDVFLKSELDKFNERVKVIHILEECDMEKEDMWRGRITADMIKKISYENGKKIIDYIYVCGPPPMVRDVSGPKGLNATQGEIQGMLKVCGFNENEVFKF